MKKKVIAGLIVVAWAFILVVICKMLDSPKYFHFSDLIRSVTTERQLGVSTLVYLAMVSVILMLFVGRCQVVFWELALFVLAPIALYFVSISGPRHYYYQLLFFIAVGTLWRIVYRACFVKTPNNP